MDQYNREWRRNRVLVMQLAISSDSEESEEEQSAANGGSETQSSCHLVKEEDGGDVSCHDSPDSHSDFATSDDAFTSSDNICQKTLEQNLNMDGQRGAKTAFRGSSLHVLIVGISIDERLTWKAHIESLSKKPGSGFYALRNTKRLTSRHGPLSLYHSFIHSHLTYGCLLWRSASDNALKPLKIAQKKAIRLVYDAIV
ncbi:hypothetical protein CAPTEDRAFT_203759 [Capitella teleta]|uniref:Uncharacterized protein n=1 Tax=Capitella teleta TaxID=283909 RepID=R7UFS2_CAPTE|nr:hypothetical protein CAPTEDRAFT_203759 [Capitella teleta]|eukprot:ELU05384.1 hypothetical protein CAPTEDRAFT_203759 [Capitella teleta]